MAWIVQGLGNRMAQEELSGTAEHLAPILYEELRKTARQQRRKLPCGETLLTTALIHEAYLRLANHKVYPTYGDFLRVAAVTFRRILVDRVRAQMADKRGGGLGTFQIDEEMDFEVENPKEVLQVHDALQSLSELNPRLAQVVECKFFAGLNESETAEALGVSQRTVQRDWVLARSWLRKEMTA